jgi:hypothetical protein
VKQEEVVVQEDEVAVEEENTDNKGSILANYLEEQIRRAEESVSLDLESEEM